MPPESAALMVAFEPAFSKPVFPHVQVLVMGALLAPGRRTVASALRVMGLAQTTSFQNYHRVLNRATWSAPRLARTLLVLLVDCFADDPAVPLIVGLDDTIERRWGPQIAARGIYRDPVRSSRGHFVKASGLRWLSLAVLTEVPWAPRVWTLPFLTVLCPSERYYLRRGHPAKKLKLTDHPVEVATGTAVWHHSGYPSVSLRWVLVRDPSGRVAPKGWLSTDPDVAALDALRWYARRWAMEVTFAEVCRHLGVETQRQWSPKAISRMTPCLLVGAATGANDMLRRARDTESGVRVRSDGRTESPTSRLHGYEILSSTVAVVAASWQGPLHRRGSTG